MYMCACMYVCSRAFYLKRVIIMCDLSGLESVNVSVLT